MHLKKSSLRTRIFIAMIFLVIVASILIAVITIYQYSEQADDYHNKRLERKEQAIKETIFYAFKNNNKHVIKTENLPVILDEKLDEISEIHNLDINIYDLEGNLMRSSSVRFSNDSTLLKLPGNIMNEIRNNPAHRVVLPKMSPDGKLFKSSYSYLMYFDSDKPLGIIGVPYLQDNTFQDKELKEFLERLFGVYLVIFLLAIAIAYFLSKYITKSIEYVSDKMRATDLEKSNQKIIINDASQEINDLVKSYNNMIDQLEESALKLAAVERKHAWREMAKQVAHEIKNPLTPMRLTIQSFEHRFDPEDPDIRQKVKDFSKSLIKQIDTLSSIASAFSSFAKMPSQQKELINVVDEIKYALDIFQEDYIVYHPKKREIIAKLDKVQLTRIITNLVTNAIHATKHEADPKIEVSVRENKKEIIFSIRDNGMGISKEDASKIFEPKFTTKSSGMGLGLSMVKNIVEAYNGTIDFESEIDKGTIFTVTLPKE